MNIFRSIKKITSSKHNIVWLLILPVMITGAAVALAVWTFVSVNNSVKGYTMQLAADVSTNPPTITLNWPSDIRTGTGQLDGSAREASALEVYRRLKSDPYWTYITSLATTSTSYTDTDVTTGVVYEYLVRSTYDGNLATTEVGIGFISSGIQIPAQHYRGKVILIVEASSTSALSPEILRLKQDFLNDGWGIIYHSVSSTTAVTSVKSLIVADYNSDPSNVKAVFLLGHVAVPYSGYLAPDAHTDHYGAQPADTYYASIDGSWTDNSADTTQNPAHAQFKSGHNRNVPGDGRFDQSSFRMQQEQSCSPAGVYCTVDPTPGLELAVGRADFYDMPVFGPIKEVDLLRRYLNKDHDYRTASTTIRQRAIIDQTGFGEFSGEAFQQNGWRNFAPLVGPDAIENPSETYFFSGQSTSSYMWAYSNVFDNVNNITANLSTSTPIHTPFNMYFSSYEADFDYTNNILRALLGIPGDTLTVTWAGRPNYFFHHMGMGDTIGYSYLQTQNYEFASYRFHDRFTRLDDHTNLPSWAFYPGNNFAWNVGMALLGDPTLVMYTYRPVTNPLASVQSGNIVNVSWSASSEPGVLGYYVYSVAESASTTGPYLLASSDMVTGTTFSETRSDGSYVYMIRPVKLTTSPSGSFYNLGAGTTTQIVTLNDHAVSLPTVITDQGEATSTYASFAAHGQIYDSGGSTVTARGFEYGLTTEYGSATSSTGSFVPESFSTVISSSDLTCETSYHVRAFATNSTGTGYGEDVVYSTGACVRPTVATGSAYGYIEGAELYGSVTATFSSSISVRGFRYGTNSSTLNATTSESGSWSPEAFSLKVTGLTCGQTYYYQVFAINNGGLSYGGTESFVACRLDVLSGNTLTLPGSRSVESVNIQAASELNLRGYTLTVSGDWDNSGTFTPAGGTVVFTGTDNTLIGSTSFYNLIKSSAGGNIYFPINDITTVDHLLDLSGTQSSHLGVQPSPNNAPIFDSEIVNDFGYAEGVAVDQQGNVYVGDCGSSVQKFDSEGNFLRYIGSPTEDYTNGGFHCAQYMTFDSSGNLYVAAYREVQKYDTSGNLVMMFGQGVATGADQFEICTSNCHQGISFSGFDQGGFGSAYGVAIDSSGKIYVTDGYNHQVKKYAANGTFIEAWGSANGDADDQFYFPMGIAIDQDGYLYVTDDGNDAVGKYDTNGNLIMRWGWGVKTGANQFEICTSNCQAGISGNEDGQFNAPTGIAVDSQGRIYVGDYGDSSDPDQIAYWGRVQIFDSSGNLVSVVRSQGAHLFDYTEGLTIGPDDSLYAAIWSTVSTPESRVYKFSVPPLLSAIDTRGAVSALHLDVSSSTNIGGLITCYDCNDEGNNARWLFSSLPGSRSVTQSSSTSGSQLLGGSYKVPNPPVFCPTGFRCEPTQSTKNNLTPESSFQFKANLQIGMKSADVRTLQQFLNNNGYIVNTIARGPGSIGFETNYFGPATRAALIRFQKASKLPATGYFGPLTRRLILSQ